MLKIRLSRIGKKNKPMYRLTVSEGARDLYGRALEILGSYNPHTKDLVAKEDRIKHWLSVGAQPSATVNNILVDKKIIKAEKMVASKPGKKSAEELKKEEEAAKAKEVPAAAPETVSTDKKEEAATPAETAPAAAETTTEEVKTEEK